MMLKCLHVVFHYQTGNQQKSLKKGLTVYGYIKKNIYITTEDTYQWFIGAQKQVFIHVQYLAAFFMIL